VIVDVSSVAEIIFLMVSLTQNTLGRPNPLVLAGQPLCACYVFTSASVSIRRKSPFSSVALGTPILIALSGCPDLYRRFGPSRDPESDQLTDEDLDAGKGDSFNL
jgi:hypothetical protein